MIPSYKKPYFQVISSLSSMILLDRRCIYTVSVLRWWVSTQRIISELHSSRIAQPGANIGQCVDAFPGQACWMLNFTKQAKFFIYFPLTVLSNLKHIDNIWFTLLLLKAWTIRVLILKFPSLLSINCFFLVAPILSFLCR